VLDRVARVSTGPLAAGVVGFRETLPMRKPKVPIRAMAASVVGSFMGSINGYY
jgi:hypothetical protein